MKPINELIDDVLDVEAKVRAVDYPFTGDYGDDCQDMFRAGACATGEPLANALKEAIAGLHNGRWIDLTYETQKHVDEVESKIRAILEKAAK